MSNSNFTIAVTGHRDLVDSELTTIKESLHQQFNSLKERMPNTEIVLLTGMAEGADQLAAQVALECGISVEAILPMPLINYKDDFTEQSFSDLKLLLDNENTTVTETVFSSSVHTQSFSEQSTRNKCYKELGQELIDRALLLICLWDGQNTAEEGGTSDVVLRFSETGQFDDAIKEITFQATSNNEQYSYQDKVILWQPVNRESNVSVICDDLTCRILTPSYSAREFISTIDFPPLFLQKIAEIDCYNLDYKSMSEADKNVYDNRLTASIDWLEDSNKQKITQIDSAFVKADNQAMYHQKFSDKQFKLFAYMAASMGIFFLVYAKIVAAKIFIILYAALLIVGLFIYKRSAKHNWFKGHLTSRIIAETLRVKVFIALAGVETKLPIDKLFKLSGVKQFSGFNWIAGIIKPIEYNLQPHDSEKAKVAIDYVTKHWVEDQANYFSRKSSSLSAEHHKLEKIKHILLAGSFIAALALIFFKQSLVSIIIAGDFSTKSLLVFLMGLLPLLLGIWELYQGKMAVKELNWQYKNQAILFNEALAKIKKRTSLNDQKAVLFELAECCLMENYLWSIHRYHREQEPPSAG